MTESLLERERPIPRELARLAAERARAEATIEASFTARVEAAKKEFQETQQKLAGRFEAEKNITEKEYQQLRQTLKSRFETGHGAAQKQYAELRHKAEIQFEATKEKAQKDYEENRWTRTTLFDAEKTQLKEQQQKLQQLRDKAAEGHDQIGMLRKEADELLARWHQQRPAVPEDKTSLDEEDDVSIPPMRKHIAAAENYLEQLKSLFLPRLLKGGKLWLAFLLLWLALLYPATLFPKPIIGVGISTASVFFIAFVVISSLSWRARHQVRRLYMPLVRALSAAAVVSRRCQDKADKGQKHVQAQLVQRKEKAEADLRQLKEKAQKLLADIQQRHDAELRQLTEKYPKQLAEMKQRYEAEAQQIEAKYPKLLADIKERFDKDTKAAKEKHDRLVQEAQARRTQEWQSAIRGWQQGLQKLDATAKQLQQECGQRFPAWGDAAWQSWQPPLELPPAIRFGELDVGLEQVPDGIPKDDRLRNLGPGHFLLPAVLDFPRRASLLFRTSGPGRDAAVPAMQAVMMRLLTAIPPAKVRFTIIDPLGLGENFAAFMHLADHDEQLVTSKIWTEPQQIEQRLADLTEHMENVIQKYLRSEYPTIQDYNEAAGEVAEPFRVLVVANFPANFSPAAAQRLVSIASSGAGCGVYVLISVDTKQPLPQGFNLADLEQACETLQWKESRFVWKDSDFAPFPLSLETPAPTEFCTRTLQVVGAKAKLAKRVEVSFDFLAPPPDRYWTSDSKRGIDVPLGRAGATKRQHLLLGQGTSQHVLIAGKTGSGKSTLLHALITNLALLYSPEEVELYLVDFKKGVEFKTYASYELPHARVVAIESEREFGLSVLQRLDAELKGRGERFRAVGVNDVAGYRAANGQEMPRILLVVDEFQEFFVEDDKIAQESALLLDRLVRQGRAFGMHVLLGSQTLGGAFSLARSTIDQMAVRIALQCSEADAHMILSKENSAARLLSRPGEAIYNDSNGMVEGNDLFQVVWLSEERREQCLGQIRELAKKRLKKPRPRAIVFEGNVPAEMNRNPLLNKLLAAPDWPQTRAYSAWLGDAIAIKDPTALVYRRPGGTHLLMIGQQEEAALAMMTSALVSLAAQHRTVGEDGAAARFYLLDGTPADASRAGYLEKLKEVIPHPLSFAGWKELPAQVAEIAAEVERRQKQPGVEGPAVYWLIYGLQFFRDLRKADDDFGLSRRREGEAVSPAQSFATIINEGPGVGVYTLVWCDTLNNVQRSLDRPLLRNFEAKVLFQMSAADSSTLIDSPLASKLGLHRAFFHTEERSQPEKFRPYGLPTAEWLGWVRDRLRARK